MDAALLSAVFLQPASDREAHILTQCLGVQRLSRVQVLRSSSKMGVGRALKSHVFEHVRANLAGKIEKRAQTRDFNARSTPF